MFFGIEQPNDVTHELNSFTTIQVQLGTGTLGQGTHHITVQINFATEQLAAWIDYNQQSISGNAAYTLPAGAAFLPFSCGGLYLGHDNNSTAQGNGADWTFAGLHISNATRYAVSTTLPATQQWAGGGSVLGTDNTQFFTNDANTIGYLTLDDTPPADADYNNPAWQAIRVQTGEASTPSGLTNSIATGFWNAEPWNDPGSYVGGSCANISNLTIQKVMSSGAISVYGADVNMYDAYGTELLNVTLNGGFDAFNVMPHPDNQYVNRLYNVSLNASFAGFFADNASSQTVGTNLTFPSPGKHAIYVYNVNNDFQNITIGPATYSDYLVVDAFCVGQTEIYNGVTIQPDPNHTYPTKASSTMALVCTVSNDCA